MSAPSLSLHGVTRLWSALSVLWDFGGIHLFEERSPKGTESWLYISTAHGQEGRQQYGGLNVSIREENAGWTHVSSEKTEKRSGRQC